MWQAWRCAVRAAGGGRLLQGFPQLPTAIQHPKTCPLRGSPHGWLMKTGVYSPIVSAQDWTTLMGRKHSKAPVVPARALQTSNAAWLLPPPSPASVPSLPQALILHKYPVYQTLSQHPLLRTHRKSPPRASNYRYREGFLLPILDPSSVLVADVQTKYEMFRLSHCAEVSPVISWLKEVHPLTDSSTRVFFNKRKYDATDLTLR